MNANGDTPVSAATGVISGARVTHQSGRVDDLAAASPSNQKRGVASLLEYPTVEEAFVLSTCNRVEAYVVTAEPDQAVKPLCEFFDTVDENAVVVTDHDESLEHLLRVAAGLESVVLGEDQIMGQIRTAYEDARQANGIGNLLEPVVTKAIHVGERARTETTINEGVVSLGSAATRLAAAETDLTGATAVVVGAGEMGQLAAKSLAANDVDELVVANRTVSRADHVIDELDGTVRTRAVGLDDLDDVLPHATVVVTATGSDEPVIEPHQFRSKPVESTTNTNSHESNSAGEDHTRGKSSKDDQTCVVVDLGQPRDVRPTTASVPSVTVYDLDDLESLTAETRSQRADAAREAEAMIDEECDRLCSQLKRRRADDVIAAMYESAERIKRRELRTALTRLENAHVGDGAGTGGEGESGSESGSGSEGKDNGKRRSESPDDGAGSFTAEQREIVEAMADALVGQLLAPPTKSLREAAAEDDWSTINTALRLFDPEFESGSVTPEANQDNERVERAVESMDGD